MTDPIIDIDPTAAAHEAWAYTIAALEQAQRLAHERDRLRAELQAAKDKAGQAFDFGTEALRQLRAAERQAEKLVALLRALVEDDNAGVIMAYGGDAVCVYCVNEADVFAKFEHRADCPIIEARAALGEGK